MLERLHDLFEIVVTHHIVDRQGLGRCALDDAEDYDAQVFVVFLLHEVIGEIDDMAHAAETHDEFMDALAGLIVEIRVGAEDFGLYGRVEPKIPICIFWLGTITKESVTESIKTGKTLPSLHSSKFAPVPEPTLKTGVTAMTAAVLELVGKK